MNKTDALIAVAQLLEKSVNDNRDYERGYVQCLKDTITVIKDLPDEEPDSH